MPKANWTNDHPHSPVRRKSREVKALCTTQRTFECKTGACSRTTPWVSVFIQRMCSELVWRFEKKIKVHKVGHRCSQATTADQRLLFILRCVCTALAWGWGNCACHGILWAGGGSMGWP